MARNNLRILLSDKVTQIGGVSTANALNDYKSKYQSGSSFSVTTSGITGDIMVVLMLAENSGSDTVAVVAKTVSGVGGTTTGIANITETNSTNFTAQASGYGGVKYLTVYLSLSQSSTDFTITLGSSRKVSRILIGNYWSPKYNTGYGVQVGYEDATSYDRLQSGDLYATLAPRNKTLQFDLQYMDESDKFYLFDIAKSVGKSKPMFISVFPGDDDSQKEQMYSIYGRLVTPPNISYVAYTMYSSSLQLEEI